MNDIVNVDNVAILRHGGGQREQRTELFGDFKARSTLELTVLHNSLYIALVISCPPNLPPSR
jgi:hypothetical protein